MARSEDSRRALLWLVSAFGAVAVARYDAHAHPALPQASVEQVTRPAHRQAAALRDGQRMDINRASAEELEILPGVGPSLAKRIVETRERLGRFVRPEDLRRVRGVGQKTLEKLTAFLNFGSE